METWSYFVDAIDLQTDGSDSDLAVLDRSVILKCSSLKCHCLTPPYFPGPLILPAFPWCHLGFLNPPQSPFSLNSPPAHHLWCSCTTPLAIITLRKLYIFTYRWSTPHGQRNWPMPSSLNHLKQYLAYNRYKSITEGMHTKKAWLCPLFRGRNSNTPFANWGKCCIDGGS